MTVFRLREEPIRSMDEDNKGERKYSRTFTVESNDPTDDGRVVLHGADARSLGMPWPGDFYVHTAGGDAYALVDSRKAVCTGSSDGISVWQVVVTYATNSKFKDSDGKPTDDPLQARHKKNWGVTKIDFPVLKDLAGTKIVNAAKDVYNPPVTRTIYRKTLSVKLNSTTFTPTMINSFVGNVNSGNFVVHNRAGGTTTFSPKRVLCTGISTTDQEKQVSGSTLLYDEVVVDFELLHPDEDDYKPTKILNSGMRFKAGDGKWRIIRLGTPPDEADCNSPVPMKADGSGPIDPDTEDPNYIDYILHKEVDFSTMGLSI